MLIRRLEIVYPIRQYTEFPTFPLAVKSQLMFVKTFGWLFNSVFCICWYVWLTVSTRHCINNIKYPWQFCKLNCGTFVIWGCRGSNIALLWIIVTVIGIAHQHLVTSLPHWIYKKSRVLGVDIRSQTHMQNSTENMNFT